MHTRVSKRVYKGVISHKRYTRILDGPGLLLGLQGARKRVLEGFVEQRVHASALRL